MIARTDEPDILKAALDDCEAAIAAGDTTTAKANLRAYHAAVGTKAAKFCQRSPLRAANLEQALYPNAQYAHHIATCNVCGVTRTLDEWRTHVPCKCAHSALDRTLRTSPEQIKRNWSAFEKRLRSAFTSTVSALEDGRTLTTSVWVGLPDAPAKRTARKPAGKFPNAATVQEMAATLRAMLTESPSRWQSRAADVLAACEKLLLSQ